MAILGGSEGFPPDLIEILIKQDLRLLFVFEDQAMNVAIKNQLEHLKAAAEIEFINCEREGCWEADMITLLQPEKISSSLVNRIAEVATQKTVLVVSEENASQDRADLSELLPNSKVVEILFNPLVKEILLTGKNTEAKSEVQNILERSAYEFRR